jgi:transposase-like protein
MTTALFPTPEELTLPEIMARFPDEARAVEYLEALRWADGIVCPHCGNADQSRFYKLNANPLKKIRVGLRQCAECKKQFRVTVGTIFEDSHIPLNQWIIAWYLISGAKKGMSALQLKRHLGLGSYRSAWFMAHRIRHAMKDPAFNEPLEGVVEVDETYVGGKTRTGTRGRGSERKTPVVALVERNGRVRVRVVDRVTAANLKGAIVETVVNTATIVTDEWPSYKGIGKKFAGGHHTVNHGNGEYARQWINTNSAESFFSLLKRGVYGSFHHVSKKHLHRYCDEFAFRWDHRKSTDGERTVAGIMRAWGTRLTYKPLVGKVQPTVTEAPKQAKKVPFRKKRGWTPKG